MKKLKLLVVDDESSIRDFLSQILSERYDVFLAKNGSEALALASNLDFSIILLDIIMPGMTGIDLCKKLRSQPKTQDTPIIMLTALNEPDQKSIALLAGASDYILKPFNPDRLLVQLKKHEKQHEDKN